MRVAFFSPLPPARSGIADYSEALIESLKPPAGLARSHFPRGSAVRPVAVRYRPLPRGQQPLSRIRLRDRPAPPRRGRDARIQPASPDRRTDHPAEQLGRLRHRVRISKRCAGARLRRARAAPGSGSGLRRRADDPPSAGIRAGRGGAQPFHARRDCAPPASMVPSV